MFASKVLMIRPSNFGSNPETIGSNAFQSADNKSEKHSLTEIARQEFDSMIEKLRMNNIEVIVFDDKENPVRPDAIFPNNWISTHSDGRLITYPMMAKSRRAERREDIIDHLIDQFAYDRRYAFEYLEEESHYLEGTGSMVLDRKNRILYSALSPRTDIIAINKFAVLMAYEHVVFHAFDKDMKAIYHTNVMMSIVKNLAIVCMECIPDEAERKILENKIRSSGRGILEISFAQMASFAGNALQLTNTSGIPILVMSESALKSLDASQLDKISAETSIITVSIPTIEKYGGGSVRCMMAEIFPPV